MKIWVIYKTRKELDSYQANTWKLITGGNIEDNVRAEMDSLNKRLSQEEIRAGWVYEITSVDATIET